MSEFYWKIIYNTHNTIIKPPVLSIDYPLLISPKHHSVIVQMCLTQNNH